LFIILLFLSAAIGAFGQPAGRVDTSAPTITVAPVVSFDLGWPLFINRTQGVLNTFGGNGNGNSSSASFGLGVDVADPALFSDHFGLVARIEGVYAAGHFDFTDSPAYTVSGIDRKALLEIGAAWNGSGFLLRAGPWISQSFSHDIYENDPNGNPVAIADPASQETHAGIFAALDFAIGTIPVHPELNAHFDLTQPLATYRSFSAGLALSYDLSAPKESSAILLFDDAVPIPAKSLPNRTIVQPQIDFIVDSSGPNGWMPLERVETDVKLYAMSDTIGAPPAISEWIEESYHLPQIAISCHIDRAFESKLVLTKSGTKVGDTLAIFTFPPSTTMPDEADTLLNLTAMPEWERGINKLDIHAKNEIAARLQTFGAQTGVIEAVGTLVLPSIDTSEVKRTAKRKEYRFRFPASALERFPDSTGSAHLDLLLANARELLRSTPREMALHAPQSVPNALLERIRATLGAPFDSAAMLHDRSEKEGVLLTIDF
jgi:hypothetical protein